MSKMKAVNGTPTEVHLVADMQTQTPPIGLFVILLYMFFNKFSNSTKSIA